MTLKIRPGTVGYNNKILVSDEKFILGKNEKVNSVPVTKSHKVTQTAARPKRNSNDVLSAPAISQKNQEPKTITHNDEKIAFVLFMAGVLQCGMYFNKHYNFKYINSKYINFTFWVKIITVSHINSSVNFW